MKNKFKKKYRSIGIMSGTSLDGVDIALCEFKFKKGRWFYSIQNAKTFRYSSFWKNKLSSAYLLSGNDLLHLDHDYGEYLGKLCNEFVNKHEIKHIDLIASHGHTIFHQPQKGITFQLGDGNAIYSITKIPTVFDFRTFDVALGGQGAPLVPIGDRVLFSKYDYCLNLGGIANISFESKKKRNAFDICFCNMALNYLASKAKKTFDKNGVMAAKGKLNEPLKKKIEAIYSAMKNERPSLAREGFEKELLKLLDNDSILLEDRLRSVCETIADEIAKSINSRNKKSKILVTGGGAHNAFLIDLIRQRLKPSKLIIATNTLIDFKEALIFAFLGVLKLRGEINVLKSVTGASSNSSSGVIVGISK